LSKLKLSDTNGRKAENERLSERERKREKSFYEYVCESENNVILLAMDGSTFAI
jgi:hypothetical protein